MLLGIALYNAKLTRLRITWPTYATPHLCINSNYQTKKFYASYRAIAEPVVLLDCQLAKKDYLQINAFLASSSRVESNLKALLMKATESCGGKAKREIQNSTNKSSGGSQSVVIRDWVA